MKTKRKKKIIIIKKNGKRKCCWFRMDVNLLWWSGDQKPKSCETRNDHSKRNTHDKRSLLISLSPRVPWRRKIRSPLFRTWCYLYFLPLCLEQVRMELLHTSPIAGNSLFLISASPVHSTSFPPNPLQHEQWRVSRTANQTFICDRIIHFRPDVTFAADWALSVE